VRETSCGSYLRIVDQGVGYSLGHGRDPRRGEEYEPGGERRGRIEGHSHNKQEQKQHEQGSCRTKSRDVVGLEGISFGDQNRPWEEGTHEPETVAEAGSVAGKEVQVCCARERCCGRCSHQEGDTVSRDR
jgi:hypothetical protein